MKRMALMRIGPWGPWAGPNAAGGGVAPARINHAFRKKLFFTERTESGSEVTEPNTVSAR